MTEKIVTMDLNRWFIGRDDSKTGKTASCRNCTYVTYLKPKYGSEPGYMGLRLLSNDCVDYYGGGTIWVCVIVLLPTDYCHTRTHTYNIILTYDDY